MNNEVILDSIVEITLTSLGASRLNELNELCNLELIQDTGCSLRTNYKEGSKYRNTFGFIFELFQNELFTELKFIDL